MLVDEIKCARKVGIPIIAVSTADQYNTIAQIRQGTENTPLKEDLGPLTMVQWDLVKGFTAHFGQDMLLEPPVDKNAPKEPVLDPVRALLWAIEHFKPNTMVVMMNYHEFLKDITVIQALSEIRQKFRQNSRTAILLGPSFQLPEALTHDIIVIDEDLPSQEEIGKIIEVTAKAAKIPLDKETKERGSEALVGLSSFAAEQAASLSCIDLEGKRLPQISLPSLWKRKKKMIEQIPGLSMENYSETFDEIGGLHQIKEFTTTWFNGPGRPGIIVFIDELEKAVAGSGNDGLGDSSGTTQDQIGVLLNAMEDYEWKAQLNLGSPGGGKSLFAKSLGSTFRIPVFKVDLGGAKSSLLGSSEQRIRTIIKALRVMGGERGVYFVATCNKLHSLSPELRRRFNTAGLWFFDLLSEEERLPIGNILTKKFKVKNDPEFWAGAEGWSGANIRDCCVLAYNMNLPVSKASKYIVSAMKQDEAGIEKLRKLADGTFLSASQEGVYQIPKKKEEVAVSRKMDLD